MTVRKLKAEITYTEFIDWLVFLEIKESRPSKLDQYLAQLTAEVRRSYVKNPKQVKLRDFLFKSKFDLTPTPEPSKSKQTWFAALKVKPEEN